MEKLIKNIDKSEIIRLADKVAYECGKVASLTLAQRPGIGITVMAFDENTDISTHTALGDALVYIFEGKASITINNKEYILKAGESVVMPCGVPHSVKTVTKFKMLLAVVK